MAKKSATHFGDFCDFLGRLIYFGFLFWVLIIPEWLILTSGHIAVLFGSIFGTSKHVTKYRPSDPLFITEILQTI